MAGNWNVVEAEATTNLVTNPSFETATTGWNLTNAGAGDLGVARSSAESRFGAYSAKLTSTIIDNSQFWITFDVVNGVDYTGSVWLKASSALVVWLRLQKNAAPGTVYDTELCSVTTSWQRFELTITAPASEVARINFMPQTAGIDIYVDAVQAEAKSYVTTYCLDPNALIPTTRGIVNLEQIKKGDELFDGGGGGNVVLDKWPVSTWAYEIMLENGEKIIASGDHRFSSVPHSWGYSSDFRWHWRDVRELQIGDYIQLNITPLKGDDIEDSQKQNFAYLLGYLLGDGYFCSETSRGQPLISWTFGIKSKEIASQVERLYHLVFPRSVGQHHRLPKVNPTSVNELALTTQNRKVAEIIKETGFPCDHKSAAKYVPAAVWKYSKSELLAFLAGIIDSDGSLDKRGNMHISSASKQLVKELHTLFADYLGVHPWYGEYRDNNNFTGQPRTMYRISFKKADVAYLRSIGLHLLHPRKAKRLKRASGTKRRRWGKITSISSLGKRRLIDLTLAPDHVFIANGMITHNCDGDQLGCEWLGAEHLSTSQRSAVSLAGGRVREFEATYNLFVDRMVDIGVGQLDIAMDRFALLPGGEVNKIKRESREFVLAGTITGTSLADLHVNRQALLKVLTPSVPEKQLIRLRYDGAAIDKEIACFYQSGLGGQVRAEVSRINAIERVAIRFIAEDPNWYEIGESAAVLDSNNTATLRYITGRLKSTGQWDDLGLTANPAAGGTVLATVVGPDNMLYIGGTFQGLDGTAGAASIDGVAMYNPATDTWSQLGVAGDLSSTGARGVRALLFGSDGNLYAAGDFQVAGGETCDFLAMWNGAVWATVGAPVAGAAAITNAKALAFDHDGILYIGGSFTDWANVVGADYIVQWTGAAYALVGNASDGTGTVNGIAVDSQDNIYIVGAFVNWVADADADYWAIWDGTVWVAVNDIALSAAAHAVTIAQDDTAYIGGAFINANSEANADYVFSWDGQAVVALGSGLNNNCYCLAISPDGILYAGGLFSIAGGITLTDKVAKWNGSSWAHLDVNLPGAATVRAVAFSDADPVIVQNYDVWLGFNTTGVGYFAGDLAAYVTNDGTVETFPYFKIKRSGGTSAILEEIRNETTGKELLFDYSLLDGETLTINLDPKQKRIISDFFGPRPDAVLANSDFGAFSLLVGDNDITCFVAVAGAPTVVATCVFQDSFDGVD